MTEPLLCIKCGHSEDQHEPKFGFCEVARCACVIFQADDDFDEDDDGEVEPLDFSGHDDAA